MLSAEDNARVYGKCNNPYGHGHDYTLEVTVAGNVDPRLGRLLPIASLDALVGTVVLSRFDHRNLNVEVPEFASVVPTTENLAGVIARRLSGAWHLAFAGSTARLERVRIRETLRNAVQVLVPEGGFGCQNESVEACSAVTGKAL